MSTAVKNALVKKSNTELDILKKLDERMNAMQKEIISKAVQDMRDGTLRIRDTISYLSGKQ